MIFFSQGSGEGGEEFALVKNGAQSKEGRGEGRHENVIKTSECNWCRQWKLLPVPWGGTGWHTEATCVCAAGLTQSSHLPGCPGWAPQGLRALQPLLPGLLLAHTARGFSPVHCILSAHNAQESTSMASTGTVCTLLYSPQRQAWII